jgi:DNA-binding CsgD family transcriptional regulator
MAEDSHPSGRSSIHSAPDGAAFVGRQQEMAEITAALDDAMSGHGQLVMLAGEPGIGKTRTAQELAVRAEQRGAHVLWGRCYEEEGTPPYWPWVQALRLYVREADAEQLVSEMGAGAANVADLVPEIRDKLPDLISPPDLAPEAARFRLFDSVTTFLKNSAQRQPLMLVLDDLHWSDRSSLLLLEFLSREIGSSPFLLVGTYRDIEVSLRHPLSQTLGALVREQLFRRVQLNGLTQEEVGVLVQGNSGITLTLESAEIIHKRTDGNPFFVGEVIRHVTSENVTEDPRWSSIIPEGVRDAIGRRLTRLSEQCNETLATASIVGREFDFRLLISLMGDASEDQLLAAMDEAEGAHLIEQLPQTVSRYQFSHALIQETLFEELSTTRRVRLHARIAEGLEELHGSDADAHAAELAQHFAEAQTELGSDKLVRYPLLAGEQALAARAYEEALDYFQRGLAGKGVALTGTEPAADAESAALLMGLGRAERGTRERQSTTQVGTILTRAFDYYVAVGDSDQAVAIALHSQEGFGFIEKALELALPNSHDSGRLMSRSVRGLRANYARAQEAVHGALAIAQRYQDLDLEMETLVVGACLDFTYGRFEESLDRNRRAISLSGSVEQPVDESHARYDLMHVLYAKGHLEEAARQASAMLEPAKRTGTTAWQTLAMEANENVSSARGDWQAARNLAEQGLTMSPREANLLGCRAILEYQVGDFDAGRVYLERLLENVQLNPSTLAAFTTNTVPAVVLPLAAYISGEITQFEGAESTALSILDSPSGFPAAQNAARIGLAMIAVQRNDAIAAGNLYGSLEPLRGTMSPQGPLGPGLAADRLLGLLSQTMGNLAQAVTHFEDALVFCREAGYRPELAWSCCDYADALFVLNGPGDRAKSRTLLDEALAIATDLGMGPLMERVTERLQVRPESAPTYPSGLTEREVEVLRLITAGKTDREISEVLFIALRTVSTHVSNILNKTNAANRTEAARFASQHGLAG